MSDWAEFRLDGDRVIARFSQRATLNIEAGVVGNGSTGGEARVVRPDGSDRAALIYRTGFDEFVFQPVTFDGDEVRVKAGEVGP